MANKVARVPNLVDWSTGEVRLMSAKCNTCGTYFFPKEHFQHRPGCSREGVEAVLLPSKGKLASYTIQYYPCPPPFKTEKKITPYGIGLVEFEDEKIQVAGIITETDLKSLKLGMEMETTTLSMFTNDEKQDVVTWAFRAV
ncbi:MAG: OB-fold domain-containing protein [Desulfobacterales bacterium]